LITEEWRVEEKRKTLTERAERKRRENAEGNDTQDPLSKNED
jgi:hypothetical protein